MDYYIFLVTEFGNSYYSKESYFKEEGVNL